MGTSHGSLLDLVRSSGGMSRRQLIEETGMSRGTLYERLDTLARLGLIYDAETLGATGGRPARRVRFEDRGRVALAVDFGHTHARVSVTDLDGTELRAVTRALTITEPPETVL
ncbi:MAG TPA: winged helix-turn-helix domain-containing protein, partial [Chloroflexota bacterium]|nr:winged helix-turn-helix domain-containing protein [Chloroflexota bacterium]